MESSQGLIKSVFRAITGSRHKTRKKQVTGILPMPVANRSHTLATSATAPTKKTLSEDVTWVEVETRPPSPVPTTEEEVDKSSNKNQLGESYVADVQHGGINV